MEKQALSASIGMTNTADVRLRRPERAQVIWQAGCCDELIPQSHQARVIWAVVGKLDMSAFCESIKARDGVCGRDATDPRLLIALWLYAATRGIGSARELNRLCAESRPYQWICGGVSLNYHTLADFRVGHSKALDELFTRVIASLVEQKLVKVSRISQDGTRVRACAGASSFRSNERLGELLIEAKAHVEELWKLLDDPEKSAGLSAKKRAARRRAAREKVERIEAAVKRLPELKEKQKKAAEQAGNGEYGKKLKKGKPRLSTTDPEARVMKMPNGGFLVMDEIDNAVEEGVTLFVPPTIPRDPDKLDQRYIPKRDDTEEQAKWRTRMGADEARTIYKERASTVETVNADLKTYRGLDQFLVRGLEKVKCAALWSALAYNLMHFGGQMIG